LSLDRWTVVSAQVQADGRTKLTVHIIPYPKLAEPPRARVTLRSLDGERVEEVVLPLFPTYCLGKPCAVDAESTLDLPAEMFRASVVLENGRGQALSSVHTETIAAASCGLNSWWSPAGPTASPAWLARPQAEPLEVHTELALMRMRIPASEGSLLRLRLRRPGGSLILECIDSLWPNERQWLHLTGTTDWPERVTAELSLFDDSGRSSDTQTLTVDVVRHIEPSGSDDLSPGERILLFGVLPFLVGFAVVSGWLRRGRR